jgi:sucrose-6-phosphate hydrolase SacC (GH32 family)
MQFKLVAYILIFTTVFIKPLTGQAVFKVGFDEPDGTATCYEAIGERDIPVSNQLSFPERINGVSGNALRLDGYSTWASLQGYTLPGISREMTVEAWFAPEAFNSEKSALVSQRGTNSGFSLEIGSYGKISWVVHADNTLYQIESTETIEPYQWYHLVGTINLDEASVKLYINGKETASRNTGTHASITLPTSTLYLGRHSNDTKVRGFLVTAANGALDEVTIYNNSLDQSTITEHYNTYKHTIPDLTIDPEKRFAGDHLRPQYHVMPNTSWTNEAYGMIYYNSLYHLFSQKNPNAPQLHFMHWGHYSSPDLVQWREEKIPLAPAPGFDDFGVWSGTTIKDPSGIPAIFYTGVNGVKAGIGLAFPEDDSLISWRRYEGNPIISSPPAGYDHMDFRDPYLWKTGDTYYMIVGSGLNNGGGILWTYKSTDLMNWENIPHLYYDNNVDRSAKFWEMPFFYPLNEKDYMLCVTPIPWEGKRAETIYWIGSWEDETFTPYFTEPKKFEWIQENFLSPAIGTDAENRPTYIGIIPEDRDPADQIAAGWRQTFSIPRVLRLLENDDVGHIPHPNLCRLRGEHEQITNRTIEPGTNFNLPEISGNQMELQFKIRFDSASAFQIQVYKHADAKEFTSIRFSTNFDYLILDRKFSSLSNTLKDERSSRYYFDPNDTLDVRIFLDHSTLEVFVDQLVVLSCRVYPSRAESDKIDLVTIKGKTEIISLDAWQLKGKSEELGAEVCIPVNLPDSIPQNPFETWIEKKSPKNGLDALRIYPIPSRDKIFISFSGDLSEIVTIELRDVSGKSIFQKKKQYSGNHFTEPLLLENLPDGIYLLTIRTKTTTEAQKLIIHK